MRLLAASIALLIASPVAGARPTSDHRVDWERGLVIVRTAAPGDWKRPSARVARSGALVAARKRAAEKLRVAAEALLADAGHRPEDTDGRLARVLGSPIELEVDLGTEGSVVLVSALPLDGLRTAVYGWDEPPESGDPDAVVIDVRKLELEPRVGLQIVAADKSYRGPFVVTARAPKDSGAIVAERVDKGAVILPASAADSVERAGRARARVIFWSGDGKNKE